MLGFLLSDKEAIELELLIKRELEEVRYNERQKDHHPIVQRALEERYNLLLKVLIRIAPKSDSNGCLKQSKVRKNKFDKKCWLVN